jgi:hypothetical protein
MMTSRMLSASWAKRACRTSSAPRATRSGQREAPCVSRGERRSSPTTLTTYHVGAGH